MIVALARKTLIYEWRKFLPAALAVAFSGLLLLMMTALMIGIFSSAGVYVSKSDGDLWAGYPGTQSVELGRPVPRDTEAWLRMDPAVAQVEPFQWIDGDWRGPIERGSVSVFVSGIDPSPSAMMFAHALSAEQRTKLLEPASVIVDAADLGKLGLDIGGSATLNGRRVKIVAAANGLRALGGVNIVTSIATARSLISDPADRDKVAYYIARLVPGADPEAARDRLLAVGASHHFAIWTHDEFAYDAATYWMFETGAGLGFLFLAFVVFVVGVVITSQTLFAAVASSVREYAMLNALGAGMGALRRVILEQAFWVGTVGVVIGSLVSLFLALLASGQDVPITFNAIAAISCAALVMTIALISGLLAVGAINQLEPANLLYGDDLSALVAESITKTYRSGRLETHVLQGLTLSLEQRELTLVLGPSGSGKSTLLAILSGLLKPDGGRVSALGEDLWKMSRADLEKFRLEHTGFVFQGFNLFPALSALEQVMLPLDYLGLPKHAVRNQALASLEEVGLSSRAHLKPIELSGGEKQRIAIARALAKKPQFVFADEPTSALDSVNGKNVIDALHRVARVYGATVVCVSHDARLSRSADRIITMQDGRILSDVAQNGQRATPSSPRARASS